MREAVYTSTRNSDNLPSSGSLLSKSNKLNNFRNLAYPKLCVTNQTIIFSV